MPLCSNVRWKWTLLHSLIPPLISWTSKELLDFSTKTRSLSKEPLRYTSNEKHLSGTWNFLFTHRILELGVNLSGSAILARNWSAKKLLKNHFLPKKVLYYFQDLHQIHFLGHFWNTLNPIWTPLWGTNGNFLYYENCTNCHLWNYTPLLV